MASYSELENLQLFLYNKGNSNNEDGFGTPCCNPSCDTHSHYAEPSFAEGAFRYAFKARYCRGAIKYGKKVGQKCVVKKYKHNHVLTKIFGKEILKCVKQHNNLLMDGIN